MAEIDIGSYTVRDNGDGTFDIIDTSSGNSITVDGNSSIAQEHDSTFATIRERIDSPYLGSNGYSLESPKHVVEVVTPSDVDVGFANNYPKEPAAFYHEGTYYLACAVWDAYGANVTDKETVLLTADDPAGPFTQVSKVTENEDVFMHAPGIIEQNGELWVFYSDKSGGGNSIHAKHQPIDNIGPNVGDWVDEGQIVSEARDPGPVKAPDGTYYLFFTDESLTGDDPVSRVESSGDLASWTNRTDNIYDESNDQGADVVPAGDGSGDYWMITTAYTGSQFYSSYGIGTSLDDTEYTGQFPMGSPSSVGPIHNQWHSDWTSHFDACYMFGGVHPKLHDGGLLTYFEGGDGSEYSLGMCIFDGDNMSRQYGAKAYLGSDQNFPSSETKVALDTIEHDHYLEFDTTNNEYVAKEDGTYRIEYQVRVADLGDGDELFGFARVNGSTDISVVDVQAAASATTLTATGTTTRYLNAGDTVSLVANQTTGSDQTLETGVDGEKWIYLSIHRIA